MWEIKRICPGCGGLILSDDETNETFSDCCCCEEEVFSTEDECRCAENY